MIRRTLLILSAVLAVIVVSGAALLTGGQLAQTINWLLPTGWQVEIPEPLSTEWERATLPHFSLSYQQCPLLQVDNVKLQWHEPQQLSLANATIDYHCLQSLPSNESQSETSPDTIQTILALLPDGEVAVEQLAWVNLPAEMSERLKPLLETPSEMRFAKNAEKLTAFVQQQAVRLAVNFANGQLSGKVDYQPSEQEKYQLAFSADVGNDIMQLPKTLQAELSSPQLGTANLSWQADSAGNLQGNLKMQSQLQPENQLNFPFTFDHQSVAIEQGRFDWAVNADIALRGFFTGKITPNRFKPNALFPIKTALRLSLLSENDRGKGNVVLNSPDGEWLAESFNLPINIHGNVKQGNFILYSAVPLAVNGSYADPTLRFLPSALLRMTGKERFLTIDDLRFPLAGIRLDKNGINGRLQAIFRGESPDFKQIELHLDGYAKDFKAGADFANSERISADSDRWQWRFWGGSTVKALNSRAKMAGRGDWQGEDIQLSEFSGQLDKIHQNGVKIPEIALNLLEPIRYRYPYHQLTGGLALTTNKAEFAYGGELEQPTATLNFNGELENLHLKGEISAGKLGPIRLFARRTLTQDASHLAGKLYWLEQPANVFQSLFPFRSNWLITHGTIRGETAFSANAKTGVMAGGHFAIHNGAISLPNGELKGIVFSLPYQLKNQQIILGRKQAVEVNIAEINLGVPLRNAKVKVQGHLPYSAKTPLFLRELRVELLGGELNVAQFALPQRQVAYLNLRHIQFEQMLQLAQYHQMDLKGAVNATLPFWLSGKPCYICGGTFAQAERSRLKFTDELLNAMKKSGYTEQLLTYLVNDSQIDQLFGNIDLAQNGEMVLTSSLKMQLNEHQQAKINLNYRHQENMFDLWKLINYGSQFEQNIEHSIYQQLDNR
ncbi:hypothetical protein A1D29_05085 [Pasteurellaceae bacterium Orientalotternb1]|nr:hypothetical protein A1D29_05085 [Pasteurellaceae bacterium Orientalotternb1]